jgi:ADP-ribosylglycohydrolase
VIKANTKKTGKKGKQFMYGAIIGDICGSIYEKYNHKTDNPYKTDNPTEIDLINQKCYFTDDTVLTVAVADAILTDRDYKQAVHRWANNYPNAGYGKKFCRWFRAGNPEPYDTWGNGSAMRVSAIGWAFDTQDKTLEEAKSSAEITHNHPDAIKGAQSVAAAIFMARHGASKEKIKTYIKETFDYHLDRTLTEIRPSYSFDKSCQGSVPEAIIAFLESNDFVHAIQLAISIGGDSDTIACITGSIAEAFYRDIPKELIDFVNSKLPDEMKKIVGAFREKYHIVRPV